MFFVYLFSPKSPFFLEKVFYRSGKITASVECRHRTPHGVQSGTGSTERSTREAKRAGSPLPVHAAPPCRREQSAPCRDACAVLLGSVYGFCHIGTLCGRPSELRVSKWRALGDGMRSVGGYTLFDMRFT